MQSMHAAQCMVYGFVPCAATPKRSHSLDQLPRKSDPHMTHNMAYNKHGSVANGTNGMSDTGATGVASV